MERHSEQTRATRTPLRGVRVGSLFGVEVGVDWSLAIIFVLILFSLGQRWFPSWHPDWSAAVTWGSAFAAAVLFFSSILLHELAHALVARRNGIPVNRITLFMFGGLAHMEKDPPSAGAEFKMAIIGPVVSIALGVACGLVARALAPELEPTLADDPAALFGSLGPAASVLTWLGSINIVLGLFNMIPGFPLDGGRVLRAGLWHFTGDRRKASLWASYAGRGFALLLIAYGVFVVFAGGTLGGFWYVLIGWFLYTAAEGSYGSVVIQDALQEVHVREVMRARPATVSGDATLSVLVQDYIMQSDERTFPVVHNDRLAGMVSLDDVRKVPRENWNSVSVADIMTPAEQLSTLRPEDNAADAFQEIASRGVRQIPVLQDGHFAGVIRREDLMKWVSLHVPQRS
jgi:Zn-dependent protease/predicted transcriptional regulator